MSFPIHWVDPGTDVTIDDSAFQSLVAANPNRVEGLIQNKGADPIEVTNLATATVGFEIPSKGAWDIGGTICAWYGKAATGTTVDVHVAEGNDK